MTAAPNSVVTRAPLGLEDVDPERRAMAALDDIAAARVAWKRTNRRPRALTARDTLLALQFEALFVAVAAGNLAHGEELTEQDLERLMLASYRISAIAEEAVVG